MNRIERFVGLFLRRVCKCLAPERQDHQDRYCNNSFDPATWDPCNNTFYEFEEFNISILKEEELSYSIYSLPRKNIEFYDDNLVPLLNTDSRSHLIQKNKLIYHPMYISQYSYHLISDYRKSGDKVILDQLRNIAGKLACISLQKDDMMWFPFTFNFPLHGCEEEMMIAPWYSGMSQGQVLSLFCRMYELTNENIYLEDIHKIFRTFTKLKGDDHDPWVSCVDKSGNLWIEEYPMDLPPQTLNGMIFAIYGIYDYYRIIRDKESEKILKAAITTIKVNIHQFRSPGEVSYYCLKHKKIKNQLPNYHPIHINQLRMLYKITGDAYFNEMAGKFEKDVNKV